MNAGAKADVSGPQPPTALRDLIVGSWVSQAVYVAAKLGIADLLEEGPRSPGALADATGTHPDSIHRVLRALASLGVFIETDDGRFALTPLADGLRSSAPVSWRAFAIFCGERWHWHAWGELLWSVRTGSSAFEHVFGTSLFDFLAQNSDGARIFDAAMASASAQNHAVVAEYNFAGVIVDVGGGDGALLHRILTAAPGTRGVLFDLPHVIRAAADVVERADLLARCKLVPGSFFDEVPVGGDTYILKRIIHDWDDERARVILRKCRAAMSPDNRLLLVEHVLPAGNAASWAKLLDLEMMVVTSGGRERTEEEFRVLLGSAGFALERVIPTESPISIIEASPAQDDHFV